MTNLNEVLHFMTFAFPVFVKDSKRLYEYMNSCFSHMFPVLVI